MHHVSHDGGMIPVMDVVVLKVPFQHGSMPITLTQCQVLPRNYIETVELDGESITLPPHDEREEKRSQERLEVFLYVQKCEPLLTFTKETQNPRRRGTLATVREKG